jgi:putative redox protein
MKNFTFIGPLGPIECIVEPNRGEHRAVLVMAHGFRGSRDSGGRAAGVAYQCAAQCSVVRFNFTGTRVLSLQVRELRAVLAEVRRRAPGCELWLLGRSLGGAASIVTATQEADVTRLILWATPNDLRATFRHVMTEPYYARLDGGEMLRFSDERGECALTPDFLTDFDNYDLGALLQGWRGGRALLLHCEGDETVCVEQAKRNAAILGVRGELRLFPGGDHSFTEYSEQAGELIAAWLERE